MEEKRKGQGAQKPKTGRKQLEIDSRLAKVDEERTRMGVCAENEN